MIYVRYDPNGIVSVPDGKIDFVVSAIINANDIDQFEIIIPNQIVIDAIRLAVKEGRIDHNNIVFLFDEHELRVDRNGRIDEWPKGFCDKWEDILMRMLDWDKDVP